MPNTLTPQGVAAVVLLSHVVAGHGYYAALQVLAMLGVVMLLNLLAMFFALPLLRWLGGPAILQVAGSVLAILQAVLGMQVIVNGFRGLGVFVQG